MRAGLKVLVVKVMPSVLPDDLLASAFGALWSGEVGQSHDVQQQASYHCWV